jgi:dTDP-4-amino-4,6-dideoxygalactose transaminase
MSFEPIKEFENCIAKFYNSPYAIATDCCTHALELCVRHQRVDKIVVPKRTYISVPFLANKMNLGLEWKDEDWQDFYYLGGTNIVDAAVYWQRDGYIPGTFMCLSFQYRKHLNVGKGGMILTDNPIAAMELKKMSYDGRDEDIPWREQNISSFGYHYYMTPEVAQIGLTRFEEVVNLIPKKWTIKDWPDLTEMEVFKK